MDVSVQYTHLHLVLPMQPIPFLNSLDNFQSSKSFLNLEQSGLELPELGCFSFHVLQKLCFYFLSVPLHNAALNKIIQNSHFKRKASLEEQKAQRIFFNPTLRIIVVRW